MTKPEKHCSCLPSLANQPLVKKGLICFASATSTAADPASEDPQGRLVYLFLVMETGLRAELTPAFTYIRGGIRSSTVSVLTFCTRHPFHGTSS